MGGLQKTEPATIAKHRLQTPSRTELVGQIHPRMPAILKPEEEKLWLKPEIKSPAELLPLLKPYPSDLMKGYCVSRAVNSPLNDSLECIQPESP